MSKEYTSTLIKEIDLYIENLHKFQNFDISPLEEEYNKYIDRINAVSFKEGIVNIVSGIEKKQQNYDNFSILQDEAQKELDVLERQLLVLEDSDAPIKRSINSLKTKIKKAKTEIEEKKEFLNDPLRRLLGYRAKDNERIAELEATIKSYNNEISALELQRDPDEIKNLKARISSVKSRIENLRTEKKSAITDKDGKVRTVKSNLVGVSGWFTSEYETQRRIWLGEREPFNDELYSPQILHEYKKYFGRVDLLDISGYSLINYKNLFEIISTYPITMDYNKIKLDEKFSAPCQQKFISLRRTCPKNYGEIESWKNVCEKTLKTAFTNTVFPTNPREIKNEQLEELLCKKVKVKNVTHQNGNSSLDSTIRYIVTTNAANIEFVNESFIDGITMEEYLITMEHYLNYKTAAAEKLLQGLYINEEFLLEIKEMITQNPEMDLPDIIIALREDEMDYYEIANELLSFRNLYRETPEQILKTNQQFFAEKEIEQLKENARKEREMYERQAELDREAENDRARMIANAERERAQAERERVAAENRRTETMAYQARLDREAADKRAADERYEAERRQRQADAAARQKRHEEAQNAIWRCKSCAHFASCRQSKNAPFCASYSPK